MVPWGGCTTDPSFLSAHKLPRSVGNKDAAEPQSQKDSDVTIRISARTRCTHVSVQKPGTGCFLRPNSFAQPRVGGTSPSKHVDET